MEGSLDDVKRVVNDLVRRNKLKPWEAGDIIKRWKNRERRRVDRQISKQTNKACFHCRKQGHVLADCPNRGEEEHAVGNVAVTQGDGICFKCGSTEHNIYKCPRKHIKGFPSPRVSYADSKVICQETVNRMPTESTQMVAAARVWFDEASEARLPRAGRAEAEAGRTESESACDVGDVVSRCRRRSGRRSAQRQPGDEAEEEDRQVLD